MSRLLPYLALLAGLSAAMRCWNVPPGLTWWSIPCESRVNNADPTARVFNGRLYIYTTWDHTTACGKPWAKPHFKKQGFQEFCMPGYRAYSTGDGQLRRNWVAHGPVLREEQVKWVYRGNPGWSRSARMWALDVVQGDDKRYYLFFPAPVNRWEMKIGVATSRRPEGPFWPRPQPIPGKNGIDPSVLKLPNGKWVVFSSSKGDIFVQYINKQFTWGGHRFMLEDLEDGYKEGPHAEIRSGRLYLYYALSIEGKGYTVQQAGAKVTNRPEWGFWNAGTAITRFDGRTNHGTAIHYKKRNWALFHRHTERVGGRWAARKVVIARASFTPWGKMNTIRPFFNGGKLVIRNRRPNNNSS